MRIRFQFDIEKSLQAMAYLVERLGGSTDKAKLMKLLYLADRDHFLKQGCPITGDAPYAMPWGPVPSRSLDLLNGDYNLGGAFDSFTHFHLDDNKVELKAKPGESRLSESDKRILDNVLKDHGQKHTVRLIEESHGFPEYVTFYREGTSTEIPYEALLRLHHGGDLSRFRLGRPVVSEEMAEEMICPFPSSETDL